MIHYHGGPITPDEASIGAWMTGHAFLSYLRQDQLSIVIDVCQSFAVDNGAFSAWKSGKPITDWRPFYDFAAECKLVPNCDFAVVPDVIDGDEAANDALLDEWPLPRWFGAPVWHMHESIERLARMAREWPRICIGSSGDYSVVGDAVWWPRISEAMTAVCDTSGRPICKLHGLRMLNPKVFSRLPFASADSTNIARNIGINQKWKGTYLPQTKASRARVLRERIESNPTPARWDFATS